MNSTFKVSRLKPFGAVIEGVDLRIRPSDAILAALEDHAAVHGFLIFSDQFLSGSDDSLAVFSRHFGSLAARHSVHSEAVHEDILRVSNDAQHGIINVGPQWHNDGNFERRIFKHVWFHAQRMPSDGSGGTELSDLAAAYEALPRHVQDDWSRLAIINAYSGAVHPLVISHPRSGRRSLCVHLGMVGAVLRWPRLGTRSAIQQRECFARFSSFRDLDAMHPSAGPFVECGHELLGEAEVRALLHSIDALLSRPEHSTTWTYRAPGASDSCGCMHDDVIGGGGCDADDDDDDPCQERASSKGVDLLLVDNLATAHRATPSAHKAPTEVGIRILHRTTVHGTQAIDPPVAAGAPPFAYIWGQNPLREHQGVWKAADKFGVGFRWNHSLPMRN